MDVGEWATKVLAPVASWWATLGSPILPAVRTYSFPWSMDNWAPVTMRKLESNG